MAQVAAAYVEIRPDMGQFAKELKAGLAAIDPTKSIRITANTKGLDRDLARKVKDSTDKVTRKVKVKPDVDMSLFSNRMAASFRGMSKEISGGTFARVIQAGLRTTASMVETFGDTGSKAFRGLAQGILDASANFSPFGKVLAETSALFLANASQIGSMIGGLFGLALAAGTAGIVLVALNLALGAILAVVIPLVGGIAALVAELGALAGVGVGAIGLLPGALGAAAVAFGPLVLITERFQALFEKTADAVGPLYEVMERLKNAIFAVVSSDFVALFKEFAASTLPLLVDGIVAVAAAWNRFLVGFIRLASSAPVVEGLNALFAFAAKMIDYMAQATIRLGPALLEMATAALPALELIAQTVTLVVEQFADLITSAAGVRTMGDFFFAIATILSQLLALAKPFVTWMVTGITAILGPAQQFVGILTNLVARWVELASSATGQQLIADFFTSMNRIVIALEPALEAVVGALLQFGPVLADLVASAVPALMGLIDAFMLLVQGAAPGLISFLDQFGAMIADPAVQAAMTELGTALGVLLTAFGGLSGDTLASVVTVFASLIRLTAGLVDTMWPLIDAASVMTNMALSALEPALLVLQGSITLVATAFSNLQRATEAMVGAFKPLQAIGGVVSGWLTGLAKSMGITTTATTKFGTTTSTTAKNVGGSYNNMYRTGLATMDALANGVTKVANAPGWQAIIDNSTAAARAINEMGRVAYQAKNEIDIATYEKNIGRIYMANKRARTVAKPSVYTGLGKDAGALWGAGWNSSVDAALGKTATAVNKVKNKYLTNLKPTIGAVNLMDLIKGGRAYDTGKEIARYLAKGITSGSRNITKATNIIYAKNKTALNNLGKALTTFATTSKNMSKALPKTWAADLKKMTTVSQLDAYLAKQQTRWQSVLDVIKEFKGRVIEALTPDRHLTGVFGYFPTPGEVKARLQQQLDQMRTFTQGIAKLQQLGLDPALAREWLASGIEGAGNLVQGLQTATKDELAQINGIYKTIGTEAERTAEDQATLWQGVGQKTVEGYLAGISSMRTQVTTTMTKMLTDALVAAKKALGIKSPSKVFDSLGVNTVAGYIQGVDSMVGKTVATVGSLYDTVAAVPPAPLTPGQVKPAYATTGALTGVADRQPMVNVKVFIGDRELTDIARVVVENLDSTRARALLAGRRGG